MSEMEFGILTAVLAACFFVALQLVPTAKAASVNTPVGDEPKSKALFWLGGDDEPAGPYELTWLLGQYKAGALQGEAKVLITDALGRVQRETWLDDLAAGNVAATVGRSRQATSTQAPGSIGGGLLKAGLILGAVGFVLMVADMAVGGMTGLLSVGLLGVGVVLSVVGACLK